MRALSPFFAIALLLVCKVGAEVVTTGNIEAVENVLQSVDEDAWIVWDCNNTLLKPSDQILRKENAELLKKLIRNRIFSALFSGKSYKELVGIQWDKSKKLLVHEGLPRLVRDLQSRGKTTFVLARMKNEKLGDVSAVELMAKKLQSFGFDFSKSLVGIQKGRLGNGRVICHDVGIVCGAVDKGSALKALIEHCKKRPSKIVLIDDSKRDVDDVARVVANLGIQCICVHWTATLRRAPGEPQLSKEVAETQLDVLIGEKIWLSDFEALGRLRSKKRAS
jgi:hypothetical protein